jgi:hypothetical protein
MPLFSVTAPGFRSVKDEVANPFELQSSAAHLPFSKEAALEAATAAGADALRDGHSNQINVPRIGPKRNRDTGALACMVARITALSERRWYIFARGAKDHRAGNDSWTSEFPESCRAAPGI